MSIDVKTNCPVHGNDVEIFTVGKRRFCATCVEELFSEHCHEITMVTIEHEPKPVPEPRTWVHHYICPCCQHTWKAEEGSTCPNCGTDAKDPEPGFAVREFTCKSCDTVWRVSQGRACPKCGKDALERGGS